MDAHRRGRRRHARPRPRCAAASANPPSITRLPDRRLLLQRRSAVALDGRSSIDAASFFQMLARVMPSAAPPWDAIWWDARIHFVLFVHRVDGVAPGLYVLARNVSAIDRL